MNPTRPRAAVAAAGLLIAMTAPGCVEGWLRGTGALGATLQPVHQASTAALQCSWTETRVVVLAYGAAAPDGTSLPRTVGVVGCGRRATLVQRLDADGWAAQDAIDRDTVRRRSEFDLHCAAEALTLTVLDGSLDTWDVVEPRTIGVRGCGQQATYVRASVAGAWTRDPPR